MEKLVDEIYKPTRKPDKYRKVKSFGINDIWSMDLVFMQSEKDVNDGYQYILFCIDIYSRYVFARKLKNKNATVVTAAIKEIVKEADAKPNKVYVDEGGEFYNNQLKRYFKDNDITIYSTYTGKKASIIERFNRTIKTMMYKRFVLQRSYRWIDILDDIVSKYNNKPHKGIGYYTPKEIYRDGQIVDVDVEAINDKPPKFKVGDRVRTQYKLGKFDKSYYPLWTYEIFTVSKVNQSIPYTYKIKDHNGKEIVRSYYENELQKTRQTKDVHLIKEILDTKYYRGKPYAYLVSWLGYEDSEPTWEPAKNIDKIKLNDL